MEEKKQMGGSRLKRWKKSPKSILLLGVAAIAAVAMLIVFALRPGNLSGSVTGDTTLKTVCGDVQIDSSYADKLLYKQENKGDVVTEIYSMKINKEQRTLFRIYFGDESVGNLFGYMVTDEQVTPITIVVEKYERSDFLDDEAFQLYQGLMEQLDAILTPIRTNENFTERLDQIDETVETQENKLTYWTVDLPGDMRCEESESAELYQLDVYGAINSEEYLLYSVVAGETEVDSVLGVYTVKGETRPLGVKTYDAGNQITQMSDDVAPVYGRMMETINDVLQVIMSSGDFSEKPLG